jgi:hypothetical protein
MKIQTFGVERYRDCPIYFRRLETHFEYLVTINGELYTTHISVNPHWITKTCFLLGIEKSPYSIQQTKNILKVLRNLAQTTVDFILDKKE